MIHFTYPMIGTKYRYASVHNMILRSDVIISLYQPEGEFIIIK